MYTLPSSDTPNFKQLWIMLCILFILATFIQTAIMFLLIRLKVFSGRNGNDTSVKPLQENVGQTDTKTMEQTEENWIKALDLYSFIVLSISFIIFNLCFWSIIFIS